MQSSGIHSRILNKGERGQVRLDKDIAIPLNSLKGVAFLIKKGESNERIFS